MAISSGHKEILLTQSESKTLPEWVDFFNGIYTKNQIYSYCYRNGCKIKKIDSATFSQIQSQKARKYNINQDYFKNWSENMAYILGFWFADGCIYNNRLFDITVHKKDKYILKQMANELGYEGPISDYVDRQACRLNFSCKVIYDDIVSLGGTERKSNTVVFPNIPKEYLKDFIRGYFDGDGCAYLGKNGRLNTTFCCGNKIFLEQLLVILKEEAKIEGGHFNDENKTLVFGKRDSIKLGHFIYDNSPELFLKRKREKIEKFF